MKRRKLFCLLLAAVMLFSLAACGKGEDETKDPNLRGCDAVQPGGLRQGGG